MVAHMTFQIFPNIIHYLYVIYPSLEARAACAGVRLPLQTEVIYVPLSQVPIQYLVFLAIRKSNERRHDPKIGTRSERICLYA